MTDLNRRSFIKQTSAGAATLGLISSLPALAAISDSPQATMPEVRAAASSDPMIAHVTDVATGEVALLVGDREIVFRDPPLVARLMKAAGWGRCAEQMPKYDTIRPITRYERTKES